MKAGKTTRKPTEPTPAKISKPKAAKPAARAPRTASKAAARQPKPDVVAKAPAAKKKKAPAPATVPETKAIAAPKEQALLATPKAQAQLAALEPAPASETAAAAAPKASAPVSQALPPSEKESVPGPVTVARPSRQPRPVPIAIPALLLEPDHVPAEEPNIAGPGARFELAPAPHPAAQYSAPSELPESYGTQHIFLAARDPYWLLASWDLDARQRQSYNARSASGALAIRLRRDHADGPIHLEVHTKPESSDWFLHAGLADTTFVVELGYHEKNSGAWKSISTSRPATTPRDRAVAPVHVEPPAFQPEPAPHVAPVHAQRVANAHEVAPATVAEPVPHSAATNMDVVFVTATPAAHTAPPAPFFVSHTDPENRAPEFFPAPAAAAPTKRTRLAGTPRWTSSQAGALEELISLEAKKTQAGSLEIEELLRRRSARAAGGLSEFDDLENISASSAPSSLELLNASGEEFVARALGLAQPGLPSSLEAAPAASPRKGFWFKVNAELIIYGSTEPDAHVSIGGRPIRLRADGSFSYRFALPDGEYELPVIALAHDGHDGRLAELSFMRGSRYSGDVPAHPQDAALKPPTVAAL
jgi:hypothetical protein